MALGQNASPRLIGYSLLKVLLDVMSSYLDIEPTMFKNSLVAQSLGSFSWDEMEWNSLKRP